MENDSLSTTLFGEQINVNVNIDMQSVILLSVGIMVALIFGQVIGGLIVKNV